MNNLQYIKKNKLLLTVLLVILLISTTLKAQGLLLRGEKWQKFKINVENADFFVSPSGNDSWSGTLASVNNTYDDGPFKTIQKAKEAVRELKRKIYKPEEIPIDRRYIGSPHTLGEGRDILVLIRDGYYSLDNALEFSPEDGGERVETNLPSGAFEYHKLKDYFVTYAAYPGEHPLISGGEVISNWEKENEYWVANVEDLIVKKLIIDGTEQTLARTPNSGYYKFPIASKSTTYFSFNPGEIKDWSNKEDNRIIMYLRWHHGINSISKVDESKNIAYLEKPEDGIIVISPRYYIENVKSLLDYPGEWYYDKKEKKIYLIPEGNIENPNQSRIVAPVLPNLINIQGIRNKPVRNLRLYGLAFESTESESSVISIKYANKCEVVDSKITSVGGVGIKVGFGSYQTRILNNHISKAARGAISVEGNPFPEHWSEIIREVTISNNYIEKCGDTSVRANNALYTTISNNEITNNLGRYPIYVGGWSNHEEAIDGGYTVEYNHIHHVQSLADDSGVITSGGYTYNSVIRGNLIHHVSRGEFNDNVAIWFDNMSYGWTAEENIFYALEQGEMKLCAANLVDNLYQNNYRIEKPEIAPEGIISGKPKFESLDLKIENSESEDARQFRTGDFVYINANVRNNGSSGIDDISLFVNGKVVETKRMAIIKDNTQNVKFDYLISQPGEQRISIGNIPAIVIEAKGQSLAFYYDSLTVSSNVIPVGDEITVAARIKKVLDREHETEAELFINNDNVLSKNMIFKDTDILRVEFNFTPEAGESKIRIGNSKYEIVDVYQHKSINIKESEFAQYCDSRAEPHKIYIDKENNKFRLETAGIDFFHGEDSYASAYFKEPIEGNFVATVKVTGFGDRTNEWYRAGLFARNDMTKSFGTGMGSKGSVLMFVSPGRAGMNWDEFGDGCMHKANSQNHPQLDTYPMWIKLVRHGNSFSGYVSYDGENWLVERHTDDLPGINEAIHLGIASGGPDQLIYSVEFADLEIIVEEK